MNSFNFQSVINHDLKKRLVGKLERCQLEIELLIFIEVVIAINSVDWQIKNTSLMQKSCKLTKDGCHVWRDYYQGELTFLPGCFWKSILGWRNAAWATRASLNSCMRALCDTSDAMRSSFFYKHIKKCDVLMAYMLNSKQQNIRYVHITLRMICVPQHIARHIMIH